MSFPRTVRDYQIRLNSLDFLSTGNLLTVDGMNGPKTRKAIQDGMLFMNVEDGEDLFDSSGMTRVHWHWTAGSYTVTSRTKKYYNDLFDEKGNHYDGASPAQQQAFYIPGQTGVSHTLSGNTGAAGLSVACMAGATTRGSSVDAGKYPITWEGIDAMLERTMEYCRSFDIRVSPWTTLSHSEVQINIGIRQRGKWDIRCLPNDLKNLQTARIVGNTLRKRMVEKFG